MGADGIFIGDRSGTALCPRGESAFATSLTDTLQVPRVRFDMTGNVVDTIASSPLPPPRELEYIEVGGARKHVIGYLQDFLEAMAAAEGA